MAEIMVAARLELDEAFEWYEAREVGLGPRLLAEAREAVARIDAAPDSAPPWIVTKTRRDVRSRAFRSFPYRVIYVPAPRVVVVAFAHNSQRPGYWARRLREVR